MGKFNKKVVSKKAVNLAGGKAFSMKPKEELMHAVLSTFLEDKFYESGDARLVRIQNLVAQLVKNKQETFVAKLATVARLEFNLRSVSHALIGELAMNHKGDSLVMNTIINCAIRPDDLTEIVAYVGKPLPKQVKRGVRRALLKFNRYQLAKYRGEGKDISLVDVFNYCHPKPEFANKEQKKAWKDLMTGKLASFDTWETEISAASGAQEKKKAWESLIEEDKLGYMALLRNCNNYIKSNVRAKYIKMVASRLSDPKRVQKSRQLPFRFTTAYDNVTGNRTLLDAISEAMDIAVGNAPALPGQTLIALDCSGSMSGDPMKKGAIFAATLLKQNKGADFIMYDTDIRDPSISSRPPIIDIAKKIEAAATGGGTSTPLVFKYALEHRATKYRRIIIISDNESWSGGSTQRAYSSYTKSTGNEPYIYAIDIQGYGTTDLSGGKVMHLIGWSNRLLDFIGAAEKGDSMVEYVENYQMKVASNEDEE